MPDNASTPLPSTNEPRYRIGEVARRTGLSPRAIRLYEEKGLLEAPIRNESGYRLYREGDLRRLEQIRALRRFGFELAAMAPLFETETPLDEHWMAPFLARIEEELAALHAMQDRLRLVQSLPVEQRTDPVAMRETLVTLCQCEAYFTPEELLALHTPTEIPADEVGSHSSATPGAPDRDPVARWAHICQTLEDHYQAGTSPKDQAAQALIRQMEQLIVDFLPVANAEPAVELERFWHLMASNRTVRIEHGLHDDLWGYVCGVQQACRAEGR